LSLVLDWGDGTLGSPVDGGSVDGFVKGNNVLLFLMFVSVSGFHLGLSEVREFVVSDNVGVVGVSVESFDFSVSGLELLGSEFEFSNGSVGFSVFGDEFHEFVVSWGHEVSGEEG